MEGKKVEKQIQQSFQILLWIGTENWALAGVAQWIERKPANQKVTG